MSGQKFSKKGNKIKDTDIIGIQDILLEYIFSKRWKNYRQFARYLAQKLLNSRPRTSQALSSIIKSFHHPFFSFNEISQKEFLNDLPSEYIIRRIGNVDLILHVEKIRTQRRREPISKKLRLLILERDNYRCRICGKSAKDTILEVDHIVPVAKGGTTSLNNLQTLCIDCNRGKSDLSIKSPHD